MFVTKVSEKLEARRLRMEEGASIKVIAAKLEVAVSSVSRWVRDIELTPEQLDALRARNPRLNSQLRGHLVRSERTRMQRAAWQEVGRADARGGDQLHRLGCMLFWAEGTKSRNAVRFTNSDVAMMRLFRRFLCTCFEIQPEQLRFTVNCFLGNGLSLDEIEAFWLSELALPPSSLRPAAVNRVSASSSRTGRTLLHGTGQLSLYSTEIVQRIYGAIQEYGGFERPEWLD